MRFAGDKGGIIRSTMNDWPAEIERLLQIRR